MMFILAIGIVALLYYLYQQNEPHREPNQQEDTPEEILSKRYAMGEIDSEAYENMKSVLKR